MRDAAPQGTYKVQALDRAFAVLDLLGESETPLGLAQVAASLQLHKSTAHRFLMVLERHRMVERTANGKFRLGLRLFDFGNRAIEQYDLRDRAQPHLRRLVAETEETAHLALLEAARVIYIDKIEPTRSVRMITRIGASNPVHCTSVGKAILAFLPPERAAEILTPHPLRAHDDAHHRHPRGAARGTRKDAPPRLRGGRRGTRGRPALHRRAGSGCAAAAGRGGKRLRDRRSASPRKSCPRSPIICCNACAASPWTWATCLRDAARARRCRPDELHRRLHASPSARLCFAPRVG